MHVPLPLQTPSAPITFIKNDEKPKSTTIVQPTQSPSSSQETYWIATQKRWAEAQKTAPLRITRSTKNLKTYHNPDAGITFTFPASLILTSDTENKTW